MNLGNLSISRFKFEEIHTGGLFPPDFLEALKSKTCPYCSRKLYKMSNGKLYWCKAKSCPQKVNKGKSYVVSAGKVEKYE